jgi:hypothetical protein
MNVKPGDLAMIVRSSRGHEGKLVTVERYHGHGKFWNGIALVDHGWFISGLSDGCKTAKRYGFDALAPDSFLRPIRPQEDDAQDDTLLWLPVTSRIKEQA